MKRKLRSPLDLLFPTVQTRVQEKQVKQKAHHDGQKPLRQFTVNEKVYVKNFPMRKPKWMPGTVVKVMGPLSYEIELENGTRVRRHVNSVKRREENQGSQQASHPPMLLGLQTSDDIENPETSDHSGTGESGEPQVPEPDPPPPHPCQSIRTRNPPERYGH